MSDLSVGSTFAGCRLDTVAGRGGMGIVYRATQLALDRQVALKAMAPDLAQDADYRERFQRESHIAASIDHPNVIPVYEAGELGGTLYLLMRWVDGTDLRTLLRSSERLAPARALRLLRPVASALSAAHRRGLVHRDIKPANVLIARGEQGDEEHVYLTDFGIARRTEGESAMTRTGMFVGTVDYSAPERIEGSRGDARSDIYSFGCMLFETLTGHVPFERPSEISKIFAHVNDPVPSLHAELDDVPEALDAIVQKTMAKRPTDRFDSAAELAGALSDLLQELDTHELELRRRAEEPTRVAAPAKPAPAKPAPAEPAQTNPALTEPVLPARPPRRRALIVGSALAVAAVAAVLIAVLSGGKSGSPTVGAPAAAAAAVRSVSGQGISAIRTIDLGGTAGAISPGLTGAVWISVPSRGALARVTAAGHVARFAVGGHPKAVAAGQLGVWVTGSAAGPLARLDLVTGAALASASPPAAPVAVTADRDGSAWTASAGGSINHIGLDGGEVGSALSVGGPPKAIGSGEGWIWVPAATSGLWRIPRGSSSAAHSFTGGPAPIDVGFDRGVWIANANGHVTRFDPRPQVLRVVADLALSARPVDAIAAAENRPTVWALSRQVETVYRISIETERVTGQVTFASSPVAVALAGRYAWVATADGKLTQLTA